jgi:hypothetical protein
MQGRAAGCLKTDAEARKVRKQARPALGDEAPQSAQTGFLLGGEEIYVGTRLQVPARLLIGISRPSIKP